MANKKLIEDLETIAFYKDWDNTDARSAAARALEEIEWLQDQVNMYEQELAGEDY